jgi:hypothetical protein
MNYKRKLISVSDHNYIRLKKLGLAGDSFNDVLTYVLNTLKECETKNRLPHGEPGLSPRFTSAAIRKPKLVGLGEQSIAER